MKFISIQFITIAMSLSLIAPTLATAQRTVKTDSRILYHNGPMMTATSNIYFIWYGNWGGRENTFYLLTDFATSFGGSPYGRINTTYTNSGGQSPSGGLIYGGAVKDLYSQGASLTHADLEGVVKET